jgi:hypothetical protein
MKGTIRIQLDPGTPNAPLNARIAFLADDGTVYGETDHIPLAAGQTLSYGPVSVAVLVESKHQLEHTPPAPASSGTTTPPSSSSPPVKQPSPGGRR